MIAIFARSMGSPYIHVAINPVRWPAPTTMSGNRRVLLSRKSGRTGATPINKAAEVRAMPEAEERALARATVEREHGRGTIHQRKTPVPYVAQVNIGRVSVPRDQRNRLCR